jgi:hypothetical protein
MVIKNIIKRHFLPSLRMLEAAITTSSKDLWNMDSSNAPLWQHVMHTLESMDYFFTDAQLPYMAEDYKPHIPYDFTEQKLKPISQKKCKEYFKKVKAKFEQYLNNHADNLLAKSPRLKEYTILDLLLAQIRHIQYHAAYCSSIFSRNGLDDIPWVGYSE